MDYQSCASLTAMFFERATQMGDRPFLWTKRDRAWVSRSWREIASDVNRLARGLRAIGVQSGDRVMLVSESRPEWLVADMAIMAAGAISVPAYVTNTVADHLHVLNNSGAKVVLVSTRALAERVMHAAWQCAPSPTVVGIEPPQIAQNSGVPCLSWAELLEMGDAHPDFVDQQVKQTRRDDTACLIYTSGTGGAPKGVMLSHGAIICNCMGAHELLKEMGLGDEVFLSFLPLSHAYEHTAGQFFPVSLGAQIYYAESIEALSANIAEVKPTIMTAVPRLYEVIRGKILHQIERTGGTLAKLFLRTVELGSKPQLGLLERLENMALSLLVRRKVRARFGGRLKAFVSGGAPLNADVGSFFLALGVRILQGYGQTESAPVISCNPPSRIKIATVGPPLKGVEVKLAEDGEICVRGELVMQGYWRDEQATAAVIRDGRWLHTGDIGEIDADGYIRITDRKKDIIVNSGGDNISPQRVEGFLTLEPEIAQAMVYGDKRPHLVALIVPDEAAAQSWARKAGKPDDLAALIDDGDFSKWIGEAVSRVNRNLSPTEKVRKFTLSADPFTVANGMCTPTMKIRRHVIRAEYGKRLEDLYER